MSDNLLGIYAGVVTKRDDPERLCRIKVRIPAILEPQSEGDGPWAYPKSGGSAQWGKNSVPPLGAAVFVQFINGDIEKPIWEPGWHGKPLVDGQVKSEAFPEHQDPDIHVFGIGPFRLVIDDREGQRSAVFTVVKEVNGTEESMASLEFNYEDNSVILSCESALGLKSGAIIDMDAITVQVAGRKITPSNKPIN